MEYSLEPCSPPHSSMEWKVTDSWDVGPLSPTSVPYFLHTSLAHANAGSHLGSTFLILANPRTPGAPGPLARSQNHTFLGTIQTRAAECRGRQASLLASLYFVLVSSTARVSDLCGP